MYIMNISNIREEYEPSLPYLSAIEQGYKDWGLSLSYLAKIVNEVKLKQNPEPVYFVRTNQSPNKNKTKCLCGSVNLKIKSYNSVGDGKQVAFKTICNECGKVFSIQKLYSELCKAI